MFPQTESVCRFFNWKTRWSGERVHWYRIKSTVCKEQDVPVEERRVRRKKRMVGENAGDAGLTVVEEVRRCMFEALDRYKIETEKRFNEITQLNYMFAFLNSHEHLQNKTTRLVWMLLTALKKKLTFRSWLWKLIDLNDSYEAAGYFRTQCYCDWRYTMVNILSSTWLDSIFVFVSETLSYHWCFHCQLQEEFL